MITNSQCSSVYSCGAKKFIEYLDNDQLCTPVPNNE